MTGYDMNKDYVSDYQKALDMVERKNKKKDIDFHIINEYSAYMLMNGNTKDAYDALKKYHTGNAEERKELIDTIIYKMGYVTGLLLKDEDAIDRFIEDIKHYSKAFRNGKNIKEKEKIIRKRILKTLNTDGLFNGIESAEIHHRMLFMQRHPEAEVSEYMRKPVEERWAEEDYQDKRMVEILTNAATYYDYDLRDVDKILKHRGLKKRFNRFIKKVRINLAPASEIVDGVIISHNKCEGILVDNIPVTDYSVQYVCKATPEEWAVAISDTEKMLAKKQRKNKQYTKRDF